MTAQRRSNRRRLLLEVLDEREVLSVTLPVISEQTLSAGAPLQVALNGSDSLGNALNYSVTISNSNLSDGSGMTPTLSTTVPTGNPLLKMSVSYTDPTTAANSFAGDLVFELAHDLAPNTVDEITNLVTNTSIRNQPYFDGLTFHRIISGFMAQGGDPNGDGTGGPGFSYDDEFNQNLRFTGSGVLALANSGSDTNGSQFFITDGAQRFLDFRYTIFGFLISGQETFAKIMTVPVHAGSSGESSSPDNTVTITSASIVSDTQDNLVRLTAPKGSTGSATVTVTATDAVTGDHAAQSFQVTVAADTTTEPPFFSPTFNPIQTGPNSPITVTIPGVNVSGGTVTYSGSLVSGSEKLTLSVNSSTGQTTLTPNNATPGVYSASFSVKNASSTADNQIVPIYINPASPSSIQLLSEGSVSTTNTTALDNTAGNTLQFQVSGVTAGNQVELFADGILLGAATATDTTVSITTNGTTPLTAGAHQITARQTLANQTVNVGNLHTTANLTSAATSPLTLTVTDSSSSTGGSGDSSGSGDTSGSTGTETGTGTASLSGYVFVDMNGDGQRVNSAGQSQLVMSGVTVRLYRQDSQGNWNEVTGSPVQTDSDGAYHFSQLDAASYRIGVSPPPEYLDGASLVGTIGGTARGTAGTDQIDAITLGAGEAGSEYDFSLGGLQPSHISRRLFLASTPAWDTLHVMLHAAPTVTLSGASGSSVTSSSAPTSSTTPTSSATFAAGDSAVVITSGAAITSPGSPTLVGMTITLVNPPDGASELLSVDATGTTITSSFSSQVLTLSGVADRSKYQSVLDTLKYQDTASAPAEGQRLVEIVANDGTAHSALVTVSVMVSSTSSPTGTTPTQTAPAGYSIVVDSANLTSSNATSTGFTLSGATVDATYNYTVTSSGGGTVTGNGTVTSATQDVTGIDVSSLSDGTLTYSVTLTNSVGAGAAATATATLNRAAPTGYSITADSTSLNSTSAQSTGFTFAGATVGATYEYTVTSDAGGTPVTGSGVLTSETQDVTGINVASLPNGTLTFSVTLTSAQGTGAAATATATLTQNVPSGYAITSDNSAWDATNSANAGFKINGGEVGATFQYSITSSGGGSAVTASGSITVATQDVTGLNLSSLGNGTLTFSVTLTNAQGTGAPVTTTATLTQTAPADYTIGVTNASLTTANDNNAGFTIFNGEVGAKFHYTVTSSAGGAQATGSGVLSSSTQTITGVDLSALPAGTLTFSVTLSNGAGTGAAVTDTATLVEAIPTGYLISPNDSQLNADTALDTGFQLVGAQVGATYNFQVTSSGGGTPVTGSGTVTSANQNVTGINVASLPEGTLTFSVTLTNGAGTGAPATAIATLAQAVPQGYHIVADQDSWTTDSAQNGGFTFSNAEVGATYHYTVTSSAGDTTLTGSGTITSATQDVTGIDLTPLKAGTLTFSVTLTNASGTGSLVTATASLIQAPPANYLISLDNSSLNPTTAQSAGFTIFGGEIGATYEYTVTSDAGGTPVTGSGVLTSETQDITGIDVSTLPAGVLTFSVTLANAAGTGSPTTAQAILSPS